MPVTLKASGDRELWVVHGKCHKGEQWEIPVFCDPMSAEVDGGVRKFMRMYPAVGISEPMKIAIHGRAIPYVIQQDRNWTILAERSLHEIAYKAPGITPGYYFKWPGEQADPDSVDEESVDPDPSPPSESFIKFVHQQTQIIPYPTLKLVWRAIAECGFDWVLKQKKPINLGWIELIPSPYRANWCQILQAMYPGSTTAITNKNTAWRENWLNTSGFMVQILNSVLLALNTFTTAIYWRIEVLHSKEWWRAVEDLEGKKKAKLGGLQYTYYVSKMIVKYQATLLKLYREWVREAARPAGQIPKRELGRGEVLTAWIPPGRVRPQKPPSGPVQVVVDSHDSLISSPTNEAFVEVEATARLLSLSSVQQNAKDMRDAGVQ